MKKLISNIVFTKNRPLQLDAYLESLHRYLRGELIQTYIIYKVELFVEEYEQLFRKYPNCIVIRESDFYSDFLRILGEISTEYILFGVDDVVYFDSIDFDMICETFDKYNQNIFGFSLKFNLEKVKADPLLIDKIKVAGQTIYSLNWTKGRTPWTHYPFELCATVYPTALIKRIIKSASNNNPVIKKLFLPSSALIKALGKIVPTRPILKSFGYFYNPNTLESWNCRWCQNNRSGLPGFLFFQKTCASAIQVNMVNTLTNNDYEGSDELTVEALAEKYKQGYRFDLDFIAKNKPAGTHSGRKHFKLRLKDSLLRNESNLGKINAPEVSNLGSGKQ